ncbi:MAG: hypothetical protein RLZZ464_510 [Pseudomonadota bacterium]|jgi:fructan beta-fructosidase
MKKETEKHARPAYHFTPQAHWMNDPNGLVFHEGVYHLFYQYHPYSTEWGPMHWGHASTTDLIHWQEHAVALEPDDLGMIFSGSAVLDAHNTSGLSPAGQAPLVAVFTHSLPDSVEPGLALQQQSLAYSVDAGLTWQKYAGNPVISNPGLKDFRDPKVFWHEASSHWVMSLACGEHIAFYASTDLKAWRWLSNFGHSAGAHGGVWECPDLVALSLNGRERWVLLVSLNPGGPQGGSATQYFVGDFDGVTFTPEHADTRWVDWGADNYAGVTWSNTPGRCLFIAWMSNWRYAHQVPTSPWRGAMTLPRDLQLQDVGGQTYLCSPVAAEVAQAFHPLSSGEQCENKHPELSACLSAAQSGFRLNILADARSSWFVQLQNEDGQQWRLSFDREKALYEVDRSQSQSKSVTPEFAVAHRAPRLSYSETCEVAVYVDAMSMETIADQGLTSITSLVFPDSPWTAVFVQGNLTMSFSGL